MFISGTRNHVERFFPRSLEEEGSFDFNVTNMSILEDTTQQDVSMVEREIQFFYDVDVS